MRCILPDADYDRLFPGIGKTQWHHPLWSLLATAISEWLSAHSGLPVDFQIQRMSDANAEYPDQPRCALGLLAGPSRCSATASRTGAPPEDRVHHDTTSDGGDRAKR